VIRIRKLSVWYGDTPALQDVSLEAAEGECILVTGPSGCGKSTLGRALSGLIPHAIPARLKGSVEVHGRLVSEQSLPELARSIGFVMQNPGAQLFHLRVSDEIAFGPRNLGAPEDNVQQLVEWALSATGLASLRDDSPAELSGGQKQRVAIASALAMRPRLLVLDEPTASLDVPGSQQVIHTLQQLRREQGLTIVIIEHRLAEMARLCERAVILDQGRLVADGPFQKVLGNPVHLARYGLRRPVEKDPVPWNQLLKPNGHPEPGSAPLVEMKEVTAGYRNKPVLQDLNLTLHAGEFVALVGDNGSGKTTLALTVSGLLRPRHGKITFPATKRLRPGLEIALLFQDPLDQLFTDSVEEEVAFAPCNYGRFDQLQHEQTLSKSDLLPLRRRPPLTLSTGQQQRTALASCLSLAPRLLILDEPTLGQDWKRLEDMMAFLQQLNASGTTILLITHDYKLVHRYARRVILIENGHIALDGRVPARGRGRRAKVNTPVHSETNPHAQLEVI